MAILAGNEVSQQYRFNQFSVAGRSKVTYKWLADKKEVEVYQQHDDPVPKLMYTLSNADAWAAFVERFDKCNGSSDISKGILEEHRIL